MNLFGKDPAVARKKAGKIIRHYINAPADGLALAGSKAANAQVTVQAADDPLEKFLVRFPGDRQKPLFIIADTTNKPEVRCVGVQRPGVDIRPRDMLRAPDLAGSVTPLDGPSGSGHEIRLVVLVLENE